MDKSQRQEIFDEFHDTIDALKALSTKTDDLKAAAISEAFFWPLVNERGWESLALREIIEATKRRIASIEDGF